MKDQKKKPYSKPEMSVQKIELGVYGNYRIEPNGPDIDILPLDPTGGHAKHRRTQS